MSIRAVKVALWCCAFACSPAMADAQVAAPPVQAAPAPSPPAAAPAATASSPTVPAGTLIVVELTEPLNSRHAKSGDHFGLRLAEPISVDGAVLVPAGVTGVGEVIDAKPAGIGGRPGRLVLAGRYLETGGQHLTLQSLKLGGGGRDNSSLAVGAAIAVGLVGVLVPGGDIEYPAGTRASAKIAAAPVAPTPPAPAPSPTS